MKTISKVGSLWGLLTAAAGLVGCGGGTAVVAKSAPAEAPGYGSHTSSVPNPSSPSVMAARSEGASTPPSAALEEAPAPSERERPGLGTEWGETRYSEVHEVSFARANPDHPSEVLSLYYNDREGARAMTRYGDYREVGNAVVRESRLGIVVSLNDDGGRPLPAYFAGGRTYAIGEAGQRYTVVVSNQSGVRVEAVASVDGLDVLDGKSADYAKRGYLVPEWGSVEIDGFRQSSDQVAAFRFGTVRDSYAARTGKGRNVGVIGVALFAPRGMPSWPWTEREVERRRNADPFPGSYARPPAPRF